MTKRIISLMLAVLLTMLCASAYADAKVTWNGHTYQVCMDSGTWKEANQKCAKAGGHLVTITSAEEQKYVQKLIKKHKGEVFCAQGDGSPAVLSGFGQPYPEPSALSCFRIYTPLRLPCQRLWRHGGYPDAQ